ncbi:hypothetical protein Tco_0480802 [Tanacetum coccineum]
MSQEKQHQDVYARRDLDEDFDLSLLFSKEDKQDDVSSSGVVVDSSQIMEDKDGDIVVETANVVVPVFATKDGDVSVSATKDGDVSPVVPVSVVVPGSRADISYLSNSVARNTPSKTTGRKSPGSKVQNVTGDEAVSKTPTSEIVEDKDFDVVQIPQKLDKDKSGYIWCLMNAIWVQEFSRHEILICGDECGSIGCVILTDRGYSR